MSITGADLLTNAAHSSGYISFRSVERGVLFVFMLFQLEHRHTNSLCDLTSPETTCHTYNRHVDRNAYRWRNIDH